MTRAVPAVVAAARAGFRQQFAAEPTALAVAPGRVNLIGDHTDYSNGLAMPFAIPRYVAVAGRLTDTGTLAACSTQAPAVEFALHGAAPQPGWGNYLLGTVAGLRERRVELPGLQLYFAADLPTGAGLSSSAALMLALICVTEALSEHALSATDKVALVQQAEHEFAGVPCGILDPFAIVHAQVNQLLLLDCASATADPVPWRADAPVELVVFDSGVKHSNADGGYATRRAACERAAAELGSPLNHLVPADLPALADTLSAELLPRVRHVVTENARVRAAAQALAAADWPGLGALLSASHASLRDDFAVSCAETDALVALAESLGGALGVHGARMTGGGFGGAVIVLVESAALPAAGAELARLYELATGRPTAPLRVAPVQGARVLQSA